MAQNNSIFLFTGPEFGLRDEAIAEVKKNQQKQFGEIEEHLFYLVESPFTQVMTILQSGTLFSDGVCVICKNAELLKKKEDIQLVSAWLENADFSTILILVSDEITVDAKLEKLIPPSNRKKFWEMFENKKVEWVTNYFSKNGYIIKSNVVHLILDLVENNTQALKEECSRFFVCFPKQHEITEKDVEEVLSHNREENVFTLFNVLCSVKDSPNKRLEKGLEILQKIRLSKENSSVVIIAGLTSCFRKLVLWHKNGEQAIHGTMLQKQYRDASQIWSLAQATSILANLASADMYCRENGSQLEDVVLQKLLYEIVIKNGVQLATLD